MKINDCSDVPTVPTAVGPPWALHCGCAEARLSPRSSGSGIGSQVPPRAVGVPPWLNAAAAAGPLEGARTFACESTNAQPWALRRLTVANSARFGTCECFTGLFFALKSRFLPGASQSPARLREVAQ